MSAVGSFEGITWLPFLRKGDMPTCATTDPELYFPPPGGQAVGIDTAQETRDRCLECPWQVECLQWALDNDEYGIWGGTTQSQREVIQTNLRRLA